MNESSSISTISHPSKHWIEENEPTWTSLDWPRSGVRNIRIGWPEETTVTIAVTDIHDNQPWQADNDCVINGSDETYHPVKACKMIVSRITKKRQL